jgi:Fe2+-dicitrate sensor, membrane component
METPERIWFLLSRNISGDATPEDQEELMRLLKEQPELMQQYDMLQRLWTVPDTNEPEQADRINRILQLSAAEESENPDHPVSLYPSRNRSISIVRWAAVLVACSLLLSFFLWFNHKETLATNEIVAPRGSKTRTILPDGSTVWLNAGSRIVYTDFSGPSREVTLEGEAFFDVMHAVNRSTGEKLPFIVHAGNIDIKVLGTAFNVKSYPDDHTIETTLIRGLVQILRKDATEKEAQPLYLHPNEKIVLPKKTEDRAEVPALQKSNNIKPVTTTITKLDSNLKEIDLKETAWVYNRLDFRGDNFEELARKLERWYNVRIHFEDDAVRRLMFNGSLENETVEQAFEGLKAAVAFNVTIKNNDIYISSIK